MLAYVRKDIVSFRSFDIRLTVFCHTEPHPANNDVHVHSRKSAFSHERAEDLMSEDTFGPRKASPLPFDALTLSVCCRRPKECQLHRPEAHGQSSLRQSPASVSSEL